MEETSANGESGDLNSGDSYRGTVRQTSLGILELYSRATGDGRG